VVAALVMAVGLAACKDERPWTARFGEGSASLERLNALAALRRVSDAVVVGRSAFRPLLERVATTDPNGEIRLLALETWQTLPHPFVDDRFLLRVLTSEPRSDVSTLAARMYPLVWGEDGVRLLFQRFEECGVNPEVASICFTLADGLVEEPRHSLGLLMGSRDAGSSRRVAEFALFLAGRLIRAEPALREEPDVEAWLEAFATQSETAGMRAAAMAVLRKPRAATP
jgi:hypothetical protein